MDNITFDLAALLSPPDILGCKRALCIQPHPGGNDVGMGGTVAVLAQSGCQVHYLTVTNGDLSNRDASASPQTTARVRQAEVLAAGRHLGVSQFHFLEHSDGSLFDVNGLAAQIARIIRDVRPDVVFTPDPWLPYECHLDYLVTGRAAAYAFLMSGLPHLPGCGETAPHSARAIAYYFTAKPNTVVDISHSFYQKMEAAALHSSQMDERKLALYRLHFKMKAQELAQGRGFALGEGFKVLSPLHCHGFVDAERI